MNWDQGVSVVEKLLTAIGTIAVTLGFMDSMQEGPLLSSVFEIIGALGVLLPAINGILRHTDTNTGKAAATAIATNPSPEVVAPVVQALRAQGATVNTTGMVSVSP